MKKKLLGLFLVLGLMFAVGFAVSAKAEGEEPTYTSTVIINNIEHGKVEISADKGNVGDIVTLTVEPNILYVIDSVYANGTQILTNEDGLYQFALVEGENTVGAKFVINNEALETITELVGKAKDEGFESLFQPKNLILLIFAILSLTEGAGLLLAVSKLKGIKEATTKEVANATQGAYNNTLTNIQKSMDNTQEAVKVLARCTVLAQEGTPESRLAIIDEVTKLQQTSDNLVDEVKTAINESLEKMKEMQNAKIKAIEELKEVNDNITNKKPENGQNNGNVGRY